jgi:hypothetical protein
MIRPDLTDRYLEACDAWAHSLGGWTGPVVVVGGVAGALGLISVVYLLGWWLG